MDVVNDIYRMIPAVCVAMSRIGHQRAARYPVATCPENKTALETII